MQHESPQQLVTSLLTNHSRRCAHGAPAAAVASTRIKCLDYLARFLQQQQQPVVSTTTGSSELATARSFDQNGWPRPTATRQPNALEIEECIYIYSKGKLPIYKDKFSQVAFNLANNPSHLLPIAATDAMQLVCMNDSKYAHGTQIEQERSNFHEKVKLARESLKNAQEFVFVQEKSTKALIRCANCGSDDIYSDSKQTAGADEPATNFCTCNKCGKRWKMR